MRRIVAGIAIAVGLGVIAMTFGLSLFSRTEDAERLTRRFRPLMSTQGLAGLRTGYDSLNAGAGELIGKTMPDLQRQLHMTDAEFAAYVQARFPNLATLAKVGPGTLEFVKPVVDMLEADQQRFRDADAIPTKNMPLTVAPWVCLGLAGACLGLGVVLWRSNRAWAVIALGLVGGAMIVGPLAVDFPHKVASGDELARAARIGLTPKVATTAMNTTFLIDSTVSEFESDLIPTVAQRLGETPAQFRAEVFEKYPTFGKFVADWKSTISLASHTLATNQVASTDEFHNADGLPFRAVPWLFIVPGIALVVSAAAALVLSRAKGEEAVLTPALPKVEFQHH